MTNTDDEGLVLIGPKVVYPTPWRVAEDRDGFTVIACADGHEAARVGTTFPGLAALIVEAVNEKYGVQQHP